MAQPPSFYGGAPQTARLPMPIDSSQPLREGVAALASSVSQAEEASRETDYRVQRMDMETQRVVRERELQLRTGEAAAYIATEQGNLGVDLIKLRETGSPGAAGHDAAVNERIGQFRDKVTEHLGNDPELVSRFVDNVAAIGAQARVSEETWAAQQRALKSKDDYDTLDGTIGNNIRTAMHNGTFTSQMLADARELRKRAVEALPVPGTAKAAMLKDGRITDVTAVVEATIDVSPHAALDYIDQGRFNELPQKTLDALRTRARVAADRLDNQAEQGANAAAAQRRATDRNLVEDVNAGTVVETSTLQTALEHASASSKPEDISLAHDLTNAIARNAVNAKYDVSTIDERVAAVRDIEGKKDWQKDPALVTAHDQLGKLIARDREAAKADPLNLYRRQTGQHLPKLDLADGSAMRQRFIMADAAFERFPGVPRTLFTKDEADQLRDNYNRANPAGKADFMLGLGLYGSQGARDMMRQIAPTRPELARLAELAASRDPAVKQLVREAQDGGSQPVRDGTFGQIDALARQQLGGALARLPGDRRTAIARVATWIYAHRAAEAGKTAFDRDLARSSIEAALGGAGGKGGIGRARNGETTVLPTGVGQSEYDDTWTLAEPEDVRAAANGVPVWGGRSLHRMEFLGLTPVLINDTGSQTIYAFRSRGGSGYVKTASGADYVVDFHKLAQTIVARRKALNTALADHGYVRR